VNAHRTLDHHIITMPQDAIDSVPTTLNRIRETTFPNMESLDCVSIAFVGTNNQFEAHRKETSLAVTKVMARTQVLFQMLKLLKATRPDRPFCDMKLNHNEFTFELERIKAVQFIIDSVVKCDTADAIKMDQRISSDVASARGPTSGPSLDSLRTGSPPSSLSRALLRAMNGPQSPLFAIPEGVNENAVVGGVDQATAEEESASQLSELVGLGASSSVLTNAMTDRLPFEEPRTTSLPKALLTAVRENLLGEDECIIVKRRDAPAVNEFTENDVLFLNAFAYLFLFGQGMRFANGNPVVGTVPTKLVRHMLMQFNGKFAHDPAFLFALCNQHQRHASIRQ
jgi:hypothetical protein